MKSNPYNVNVAIGEKLEPWPSRPLTDEGAKRVLAELRRGETWNLQEFLDWVEPMMNKHRSKNP